MGFYGFVYGIKLSHLITFLALEEDVRGYVFMGFVTCFIFYFTYL